MKKLFSVMLSALLIGSALATGSFATRDLSYTAPKGTPAIDGTAEALWDNAEWTSVDLPHGEDKDAHGHALRVKLLWDEEALYLLGEMTCPTMDDHDDYVEFYIEEDNGKNGFQGGDMQVGFSRDGVVDNYGANNRSGDCEAVSTTNAGGYLCEAKILWKDASKAVEGGKMGLEFMLLEQDSAMTFLQALRWNVDTAAGDPAPWQGTAAFGELVLGAAPAGAAAPAPEVTPDAPAVTPGAAQTADGFSALALTAAAAALAVLAGKKRR